MATTNEDKKKRRLKRLREKNRPATLDRSNHNLRMRL
jgi:hypothetical protein